MLCFFFFTDTATTEIYTLSLHDALPILCHAYDFVRTPIIAATPDLTLVYANEVAVEAITGVEADLQEQFGVGADDVLGASIHRFHRNPAKIEAILNNPKALPRQATFTFGSTTLETNISRIDGAGGELLGYVVGFSDVSESQRLAEAAMKAQNIVENAPTNIMMANRDLVIEYMNPAMVKSLEHI